uniref:RHS repeat-associated core domain-containing protein n=1 Tax=Candidatus Kentrum sp. DK TaxID=2126562 RepID=A0A450T006_9GAMM|nr:MAG: RHS repeat-associated core domain-containing protein [Candidatus Kentron sp. DK]
MKSILTFLSRFILCAAFLHATHAEELVGSLPGQFSVEQGAAVYTIPIEVPPGVAGMQPALAITYNSNGGNGLLGVGFSLSGLSVITRCGQTIAQDGQKGGVYYDGRDRFCLDGQRLIAISGADGGSGTEYRTEIDSYSRIVSHGQQGSGPQWWRVETKSGQVMAFGNTQDSRIEAQGKSTVRLWAVNRISDTVGNGIDFEYYEDNGEGEYYPTRILYAGGVVEFGVEGRSDLVVAYQAGGKIVSSTRVSSISLYAANTLAHSYNLFYSDTARSLLDSVAKTDSAGNNLPETIFSRGDIEEYAQSYADGFRLWLPSGQGPHTYNYVRGSNSNGVYSDLIDMNGDGLPDRVGHHNYATGKAGLHVALNTGSDFEPFQLWLPSGQGPHTYNYVRGSNGSGVYSDLIDMNGDGLPDRVGHHNYATNTHGLHVALNTGSSFGPFELWLPNGQGPHGNDYVRGSDGSGVYSDLIDMNGDGLPDRIGHHNYATNTHGLHVALNTGSGFGPFELWLPNGQGPHSYDYVRGSGGDGVYSDLIDMNGDGLPDRVGHHNYKTNTHGLHVALNTGGGFGPFELWLPNGQGPHSYDYVRGSNGSGVYSDLIDMNGDGLPDRVGHHNYATNTHGLHVALNTGSGFGSFQLWLPNGQGPHGDDYVQGGNGSVYSDLIDMNGDGLPDRVGHHNYKTNTHGLHVALNTGSGFGPFELWLPNGQGPHGDDYVRGSNGSGVYSDLIDMNGDGLLDRVGHHNYATNTGGLHVSVNQTVLPYITAITDGLDRESILTYHPLTDTSIHTKASGSIYPETDTVPPWQVISQLQTTTPTAIQTTTYRYGGLKANLHGRGSLGFRWIEATDHTRNTITRTEYSQSFPHVGSPERVTTHLIDNGYGGNILLSETETQYGHVTGHADRVYSPHVVQTTERNYGLDRSLLTTVTTENDLIDGFGNIGRITSTTQGAGETHVKVSTNDYVNDEQRWILGRLTRASVTHIGPDNSQITRASEFAYDAQTGLLTLEAIEHNTALAQTTRYQYDQHGNQIAVTLSAPGLPDRTTETQYDALGRFPVRVTNALGHSETREYDPACGKPISLTGPNGLTTRWEYDSLCRKTREVRADGTETTWAYQWADDDATDDAPALARYGLAETASGASPVTVWYDALNREVRKDTIGFDGRTIHQETEYNARGEIVRQSLPHFVGETAHWVLNTYDLLGRPDSVTRPAGALTGQSAAITQYAYSGFATTVTDAMGRQKTTIKNALGRVVRVEEEEGAWLTHAMDAIGNLMETNANGVITRMGYDIRGNKEWMEDPDMGRWEYLYNGFGELIGQTDAKGQLVAMEYDQLGRMVRREEPEGITTWEYDTAGHGIGKLALISAPNGFYQAFGYDELGRAAQNSTHADDQDFLITTGYDQFGRIAESVRPGSIPGGFTVQHVYNAFGYLEALRVPREHILDYDTAHLHTLYQNAREMATLLLDETTDYLQKAAEYREKAGIYQQLADQDALYARALALLGEAQAHMEINAEPGTVFAPINAARELIRPLAETALQADRFPELATTLEGVAQELATAAAESAEELDAKLAELERWGEELERISGQMARMDHDPYHLYLWQAKGRDAAGRLTGTLFGNGLSTNKIYDPASGELLTIQSGFGTALPIRDLGYTYDLADNVTARLDRVQDIQESFQYDRLDRLTASTVSGQIGQTSYHNTLTYTYDAQGNMTHNSGVGAYLYGVAGTGGPGPHATTRAGDQEIQYDANGSMTQAGDRTIQWTSFNKPQTFQRAGKTIAFHYGPDRARYLKTGTTTEGNPQRTVYLGRLYEQETTSGSDGDTIRRKHFIYADGQLAAIHIKTEQAGVPQPDETRYLHRDNLGSIDTITDGRGNIVERMSYEAFGQRRAGDWRSADDPLAGIILPVFTNRGFTGHEHVDEMGLIHMNGRVYDPGLGRFLSADPNIQSPYSSQSYNRYSYVLNNPLKYSDPSGFFWKKVRKAVKKARKAVVKAVRETGRWIKEHKREIITVAIIVAAVATGGAVAAAMGQAGFGVVTAGAVGGATTGAIMGGGLGYMETGSLEGALDGAVKGAVVGALTGAAFGYLGSLGMGTGNNATVAKVTAHYKEHKVLYDSLAKIASNTGEIEDAIDGPQNPSASNNSSPLSVSSSATNRHQAARAWNLTAQSPAHAGGAMANRHWSGYGARNRNNARRFQRALRVSYF